MRNHWLRLVIFGFSAVSLKLLQHSRFVLLLERGSFFKNVLQGVFEELEFRMGSGCTGYQNFVQSITPYSHQKLFTTYPFNAAPALLFLFFCKKNPSYFLYGWKAWYPVWDYFVTRLTQIKPNVNPLLYIGYVHQRFRVCKKRRYRYSSLIVIFAVFLHEQLALCVIRHKTSHTRKLNVHWSLLSFIKGAVKKIEYLVPMLCSKFEVSVWVNIGWPFLLK